MSLMLNRKFQSVCWQRGVSLCLMLMTVLLLSCTSEPVIKREQMLAQTVLLLPLSTLHQELTQGGELIAEQLEQQLSRHGFTVFALAPQVHQRYVDKALEISGAVYDPNIGQFVPLDKGVYAYNFVRLIAVDYEFDVVLNPQLLLRTTRVNMDEAQWDGVSREIEFVVKPEKNYQIPRSAKGVSLRLNGYSRNGGSVSTGFGGVSLPYRVDLAQGIKGFKLKESFYTKSEIKEGVKVALESFYVAVRPD